MGAALGPEYTICAHTSKSNARCYFCSDRHPIYALRTGVVAPSCRIAYKPATIFDLVLLVVLECVGKNVNSQKLYNLGCQVWSSFGSLELIAAPLKPELRSSLRCYAAVTIGGLGYSLLQRADAEAAAHLAVKMFERPQSMLSEDDIRDAFGETANLLAGKIAEHLDWSGGLGLPVHLLPPCVQAHLVNKEIVAECSVWSSHGPIYWALSKRR